MRTTKFLGALLPVATALLMTMACGSDNDSVVTEQPTPEPTVRTIPYTVTVSAANDKTRATVDADHVTLKFAAGDKLYVSGTDISGILTLKSGDEGKRAA